MTKRELSREQQAMQWLESDVRGASVEEYRGWWDATLGAAHWASDPLIRPHEASRLLAGFNPRSAPDDWHAYTTEHAGPDSLHALHKWCEGQESKTLSEWHAAARAAGKHVHPWVTLYLGDVALDRHFHLLKTADARLGGKLYLRCLVRGHVFNDPRSMRGVSEAAAALGITRQALTVPLKAYLKSTTPEQRPRL